MNKVFLKKIINRINNNKGNTKSSHKYVTLRLKAKTVHDIKKLAIKKDVHYQTLVRVILEELAQLGETL